MSPLLPHQAAIAKRVIDEEELGRRHLVIYLSGAHAYGFPSPDSDLDLKAIHIAPTARLLGLTPIRTTFDRAEILEGVEIDYTSNEIAMALSGVLGGNGNYIERILGKLQLHRADELDELRPIVERALSRRVYRHYHGFASSQQKEVEKAEAVTNKKVLYVLRTAMTGAFLLETGVLETDLSQLLARYRFEAAAELIAAKRAGERSPMPAEMAVRWKQELHRVFEVLDGALSRSVLPEEPSEEAKEELERWLIALRRKSL